MPLNSTQLANKYQQTLTCCLNNNSNTIDFLFASAGSESSGGTNASTSYANLVDVSSSANVSNGTVVFSSDFNIPLKFDSSACVWKTIDDSRTVVKKSLTAYGLGQNNLYQLTSANTTTQCLPIAHCTGNEWKCVFPQTGTSYRNNVFATKRDGTLWAWGCFYQQLPDYNLSLCNLFNTVKIADGYNIENLLMPCQYQETTAFITTEGCIFTWGCNGSYGTRGYNCTTNIPAITPLISPASTWTWIDLSRSQNTFYAIKNDNTLWGWGRNDQYQLADGTTINRSSPVSMAMLNCNWCKVAGANFGAAAAIKTDGTMWTWGRNYAGLLGNGCCTVYTQCSPTTTIGSQGEWCYIEGDRWGSQSQRFSAIQLDGTLWTWGCNAYGILGQGLTQETCCCRVSPVTVAGGGTTWCKVYNSPHATYAVKTDGTMWSWGWNNDGQLGHGCCCTSYCPVSPVQITAHAGCWDSLSVGFYTHFLFTKKEIL